MNVRTDSKLDEMKLVGDSFWNWENKWFSLLPWLVVCFVFVFIVMRVIGYGYIPSDDAMRHVGKAISGKPWSEILVLRPDAPGDHNPGWHAILRALHLWLGFDADLLMVFSIAFLWLLFLVSPLPWLKIPEAWACSVLIFGLCNFDTFIRLSRGRPYIFSMAVLVMVVSMWYLQKPSFRLRLVLSVILFGLAAWIHGSWYLHVLIPLAFLLSGRFKDSLLIGCAWLTGSFLGGALTGEPIRHLYDELRIPFMCFKGPVLTRMLVTEFHPNSGDILILLVVSGLIIATRVIRGCWIQFWRNPFFWLGVVGWVLGLKTMRFWRDWGTPALMVWLALELQELLSSKSYINSLKRVVVTGFICAATYLHITADRGSFWTANLHVEYLTPQTPGIEGWLPEPGGIIYSDSMRVFYTTFYKNPTAPWRYILGFEPTFMPEEDLAIFRKIQWNFGEAKAYEPWVKKMRPEDRLILYRDPSRAPNIPGLEWHYAATHTWIGRKPRGNTQSTNAPIGVME